MTIIVQYKHDAFYAALQLELHDYRESFYREK